MFDVILCFSNPPKESLVNKVLMRQRFLQQTKKKDILIVYLKQKMTYSSKIIRNLTSKCMMKKLKRSACMTLKIT